MVQVMMRGSRLHPVNSVKHIVDTQGGLGAGTQQKDVLIKSVDAPVTGNTSEVLTGAVVNWIFLNVQVAASSTAALANVYMYVLKNPGANFTPSGPNVIGASDMKKFVIHQEMIMTEKNTTAIPRTLFKGVIKIPGSYRRFGVKDELQLILLSPGVTMDYCHQCIYKEIR